MKVIFAFDSFKGCMTAAEACHTAALAVKEVSPDIATVELPLSDGGEGLVCSVKNMLDVDIVTIDAHDPLLNLIKATYVISTDGETAYMEMAETSGLQLVPVEKRNPLLTTTYGVGDMISDAIGRGCRHIIMGIGGSATCDGGSGMIQSLKDRGLLDNNGRIVNKELAGCKFTVACDVNNPLYGENGAAYIYGPQKGAGPEQVVMLDERLRNFARDTETAGLATSEFSLFPGTGAAGGLGYALMAYLGAELKSGIDLILDLSDFDRLLTDADVVITGEGRSDDQTLMGKLPEGVLKRCRTKGIPVWLISGDIVDHNHKLSDSFSLIRSINTGDNRPLEVLMMPSVAKDNLKKTIQSLNLPSMSLQPII